MAKKNKAQNIKKDIEVRVEELLSQLTLREKVSLLSGKDEWNTVPIERLGIPSITMTDGPHGVRAGNPETGRKVGPSTCFPTGISMASSWNTELVERVGKALGEETRGMGCDILLGPCVNIVRTPLAGRNFEAFSEDPYLAGKIGVAFVNGVQSQQVGTSVKHYATNNCEIERHRGSSEVDERTLREIYLAQFEAIVKEAKPWTVMCSYNRINGVYASQNNHLQNEILKDEWGFDGFVVSDWGANHTIFESVQGGLDLEMPGPARYFGDFLMQAVQNWQIDEAVIDKAARRILRIILKSGKMDKPVKLLKGSVNTPAHEALARELAEEAITLLKNDGKLLPLDMKKVKSIAVIGPNAAEARIGGGGSSYVVPPYRVSPLEALKARLGKLVKVEYELGCDNYVELPIVNDDWLSLPDGSGKGLKGEYFNNADLSGEPASVRTDPRAEFWMSGSTPAENVSKDKFSIRWTGQLTVPDTDTYTLWIGHTGTYRLYLDNDLVLEDLDPEGERFEDRFSQKSVEKELAGGHPYALKIEYIKSLRHGLSVGRLAMAASLKGRANEKMQKAIELASKCDVALIFAGMPEGYETEGNDRPDMELPGMQNELIEAVTKVNKNTVVVLNVGSPVRMPWIDEVPALVEAYYPGQEAGNAVAKVLLGEINPSGKLSITFPKKLENNPAYLNSSYYGARKVIYGEGIFIGYRYYDQRGVKPLFPFGFGLSYTTYKYGKVKAPKKVKKGKPVEISVTVKNTGDRAGKEVVQLYVSDKASSLPRPPKELKGFSKVALEPGETKTVTFTLDERALSFYDPQQGGWVAEPGEFEVLVGSSSRDIRGKATFTLV